MCIQKRKLPFFHILYLKSVCEYLLKMCFSDRMRCMKYLAFLGHDNTFAFIGDYKIKDKYRAFVKHFISPEEITSVDRDKIVYDPFYKQSNLTYSDSKLRFKADYVWAPYISKSVVDLVNKWKVSIGKVIRIIYYDQYMILKIVFLYSFLKNHQVSLLWDVQLGQLKLQMDRKKYSTNLLRMLLNSLSLVLFLTLILF